MQLAAVLALYASFSPAWGADGFPQFRFSGGLGASSQSMRIGGNLGVAALWKKAEVHRIGLAVDWLPLRNQRNADGFTRLENAVLLGVDYRRVIPTGEIWVPSIGARFGAAGRFDFQAGRPELIDWGMLLLPEVAIDWNVGESWSLGAEFAIGPSIGRSIGLWSSLKIVVGMEF